VANILSGIRPLLISESYQNEDMAKNAEITKRELTEGKRNRCR